MTQRVRRPRFLVLFAVLALVPSGRLRREAGARQPAAKKKVLIVWGGWPGHQPKETVDVFAPWLGGTGVRRRDLEFLDSYLDAEKPEVAWP